MSIVLLYWSSLHLVILIKYIVPGQVAGVALSREVRSGAPALRVTWTAPQSDTAITHYHVRHRKMGIKYWTTSTVSSSPLSTATYLEGLSLGVTYEVQLQAESAIGLGSFSEVQTATTYDGEKMLPSEHVCLMQCKSLLYIYYGDGCIQLCTHSDSCILLIQHYIAW